MGASAPSHDRNSDKNKDKSSAQLKHDFPAVLTAPAAAATAFASVAAAPTGSKDITLPAAADTAAAPKPLRVDAAAAAAAAAARSPSPRGRDDKEDEAREALLLAGGGGGGGTSTGNFQPDSGGVDVSPPPASLLHLPSCQSGPSLPSEFNTSEKIADAAPAALQEQIRLLRETSMRKVCPHTPFPPRPRSAWLPLLFLAHSLIPPRPFP